MASTCQYQWITLSLQFIQYPQAFLSHFHDII
jgi:hypothetical protein